MKTTGYELREAIKQHELRRETAARAFNGSLRAFPDEDKDSPEKVMAAFLAAEGAITLLQTAQMQYNLTVQVSVGGKPMPLASAIKLVGGIARAEKMWRSAAGPKEDRYGGYREEETVRDPSQIRALPTIKAAQAVALAASTAKQASALRKAIAVGNATEVELEGLDAALFE